MPGKFAITPEGTRATKPDSAWISAVQQASFYRRLAMHTHHSRATPEGPPETCVRWE